MVSRWFRVTFGCVSGLWRRLRVTFGPVSNVLLWVHIWVRVWRSHADFRQPSAMFLMLSYGFRVTSACASDALVGVSSDLRVPFGCLFG